MELVLDNLPFLLKGFANTILLSIICVIVSLLVGITFGTLRTLENKFVVLITRAYIDLFRGIPILVTLFLIFFLLPELGITLNSFFSAIIALSFWASANIAEAVKGAIQSIPKTQTDASYALGMNFTQTMVYVIIPQATKRVIPSIIGLLTNLIQTTSLTVLIGNMEFLRSAQVIIERIEMFSGIPVAFTFYLIVLAGYFIICYPLSLWSERLEKSLNV